MASSKNSKKNPAAPTGRNNGMKKIKKLEVIDNKIIGYYSNDNLAIAYKEESDGLYQILKDSNIDPSSVNITIKDTQGSAGFVNLLANIIPTILMVAFFIFLFRQAKGAQE